MNTAKKNNVPAFTTSIIILFQIINKVKHLECDHVQCKCYHLSHAIVGITSVNVADSGAYSSPSLLRMTSHAT